MTECKDCRHHKGDCMLTPDSKEACPIAVEKALLWLDSELLSLHNASKLNGCEMTDDWRKAINALEISKDAINQMQEREARTRADEWTSVEGRLPSEDMSVLACNEDGEVYISSYFRHKICPSAEGYMRWEHPQFSSKPLYWMPLPEAHKEDNPT